ncbi:hypothetical protein KBD61_04490 [Patescibacteria group bacterium]|nr:hypothetical protein [Patescibacteria group bacterium]MBP9710253.1 hypothetical protein [Patescibacteria group bacterium]
MNDLLGDMRMAVIKKRSSAVGVEFFQSMGLPQAEAVSSFNQLLEQCREEAIQEGFTSECFNQGDNLLDLEAKKDPEACRFLNLRRKEGVRDEDIKDWWNLDEIERKLLNKIDAIQWGAMLKHTSAENLLEATEQIGKYLPIYRPPVEPVTVQASTLSPELLSAIEEEKPIPPELRFRVKAYISRRSDDMPSFQRDIGHYPCMNALVRDEIRRGNL